MKTKSQLAMPIMKTLTIFWIFHKDARIVSAHTYKKLRNIKKVGTRSQRSFLVYCLRTPFLDSLKVLPLIIYETATELRKFFVKTYCFKKLYHVICRYCFEKWEGSAFCGKKWKYKCNLFAQYYWKRLDGKYFIVIGKWFIFLTTFLQSHFWNEPTTSLTACAWDWQQTIGKTTYSVVVLQRTLQ